jgi:GNAT superfamily N-acetyltransferase
VRALRTVWEAGTRAEVDSIACAGCDRRTVCESRPTWLVEKSTEIHRLADGTKLLIRPLLYSDRDELARGFERLSESSRRLRFFDPPAHLTPRLVEYLTNIDYDHHFALAGFAVDDPGSPGVGVARWVRRLDHPTIAEPAVTVLDAHQGRGVGTLLLTVLAERAVARGIRTFVAEVMWENDTLLADLRHLGARVVPDEPGVARVEYDLVPEPARHRTSVRRLIRAATRWAA